MEKKTINWILKQDPSVVFQTKRDILVDGYKSQQEMENAQMLLSSQDGYIMDILDDQDDEGNFGKGVYSKYEGTCYTMLLLRRLGLHPNDKCAQKSCKILLDLGFRKDNGICYGSSKKWKYRGETCITGMVLSVLSYFRYKDKRVRKVAEHLLDNQMDDRGWNCRRGDGHTHSSFHTTINVLEGLREFEKAFPDENPVFLTRIRTAMLEACEFFLEHKLYRSSTTDKVFDKRMSMLSFPPRYRHDVIRTFDFFQEIDHDFDERLKDPLELIKGKRQKNGRWLLGFFFFVVYNLEKWWGSSKDFKIDRVGKDSAWNTLRSLRILKKYGKAKKRKIGVKSSNKKRKVSS